MSGRTPHIRHNEAHFTFHATIWRSKSNKLVEMTNRSTPHFLKCGRLLSQPPRIYAPASTCYDRRTYVIHGVLGVQVVMAMTRVNTGSTSRYRRHEELSAVHARQVHTRSHPADIWHGHVQRCIEELGDRYVVYTAHAGKCIIYLFILTTYNFLGPRYLWNCKVLYFLHR